MNKYIIAVDGGGTKTLGVLFDFKGSEINRVVKGFANFSVNAKDTVNNLLEVIDYLTETISTKELEAIQIGVAGYSNYTKKEWLAKKISEQYCCKVFITTDAEIALYSIKRDRNKHVIMVLGGTGSAIMYEFEGETRLIGGFGHLLGDEGSGYHLAITALKNIINQYEERKEVTPLSEKILEEIEADNYLEIKNFVYNNQKTEIAKLSKFIAKNANEGNFEAIQLFKNEGVFLANQTLKAYNAMNTKEEVIISIKGGFVLNAPYVKETLVNELNKHDNLYELETLSTEPIVGAYYLAKKNLDKL